MFRNVINDLSIWYDEAKRKILCLNGAKGVGKTWTITDFSLAFFDNFKLIDCSLDNDFCKAISMGSDGISYMDSLIEKNCDFNDFSKALLIFDEIQNLDNYSEFFYEYAKKHRNYNFCLIASTMKIDAFQYSHPDVFKIIRMRPMTFEEYMIANKAHPFIAAIENHKHTPISPLEEKAISTMLRDYLLIGGMPAVVREYLKTKDYDKARKMQEDIIEEYMQLIKSSNTSAMAQRCRRIWTNIPKQLSRDNKKFMYKYVEENARSREYSEAVQLLCDMGITRKLPKLEKGEFPLEENLDYRSFELFYTDHGILRASFKLPMDTNISLTDILAEENNAIVEQYVFQELSNKVGNIYYWVSKATARIPFVYEGPNSIIPVEINIDQNKKAQNLKSFCANNPNIDVSIKISLEQASYNNNELNIPIYGIWNM